MSEIKEFDLSEYLRDEEICMENTSLENCRLVSPRGNGLMLRKCIFQNVIIDGDCEKWGDTAEFYECEFRNCVFRGNFRGVYLVWEENLFKDCLFENIFIEVGDDESCITDNGFFDCNFINVNFVQDIEFLSQTIIGGKMQNVRLIMTHMTGNLFSKMQMEQVNIIALYDENVMDSVVFRDVMLEWESEDNDYLDENLFYQCNTNGLTCRRREENSYVEYEEEDDD